MRNTVNTETDQSTPEALEARYQYAKVFIAKYLTATALVLAMCGPMQYFSGQDDKEMKETTRAQKVESVDGATSFPPAAVLSPGHSFESSSPQSWDPLPQVLE